MFLEVVTAVFGFMGLTLFLENWQTRRRLERINRLLEDGEPARFLAALDEEARRHQEPMRTLLEINRSAGLVYMGEFGEAANSLQRLDRDRLKRFGLQTRLVTSLYYNNLLYTLLMNREYEQALTVVAEAEGHLAPSGTSQLSYCVQGTMAVYQYFCGDAFLARRTFETLCERHWPDQFKACNYYFLGRLELAAGEFDKGMQHIELAARLAPNSYLGQEPKRLAQGCEQVGAPGAGRPLPLPSPAP